MEGIFQIINNVDNFVKGERNMCKYNFNFPHCGRFRFRFFRFYSILVQIVQGYVQKTKYSYQGTSPILKYKN